MSVWCSGGVTTEEMNGSDEDAYISAIKLHVTGAAKLQSLHPQRILTC